VIVTVIARHRRREATPFFERLWRRSNPARAQARQEKSRWLRQSQQAFFSAPAGAQLDCFAIGDAKQRRSSNGYGSQ
jgi:hypothetical protein